MEKINNGLQYTVYDLANGRVFKKLNTREQQESVLKSWNYTDQDEIDHDIEVINNLLEISNRTVKDNLATGLLPSYLLGNPIFENDHDYTQDKVIQLWEYIKTHSLEENKHAIDEYIRLTHSLWSYGMGDIIFNFTVNNGVADDNTVIQLDFGECDFEISRLLQYVKIKKWEGKESFKHIADNPLLPYATKRLGEAFTTEILTSLWRSKLPQQ